MARRGRGDDDYEYDRRSPSRGREDRGGDDPESEIIMMLVVIGIIVAVVLAAAGWADSQFGWGLVDWLRGLMSD